MKNNKLYLLAMAMLLLVVAISCDATDDIAAEVNPNDYPVLTITSDATSGVTVNEGDAPVFTFTATLSQMLDRPVLISARQIGGTADTDDYSFSTAVIQPYSTQATLSVAINPDGIVEDTEDLSIEVGAFDVGSMYTVSPASDVMNFDVTIENCADCVTCDWVLDMTDDYGDGWNGAKLVISANGNASDYTLSDGTSGQEIIPIPADATVAIDFVSGGSWDCEISYTLTDANGAVVLTNNMDYPCFSDNSEHLWDGTNTCP